MTAGAIILAAGRSSRMTGGHKLLADWRGKPIIAHAVDAVLDAGLPPPVVVLGADAAAVRAALGVRPAHYVVAEDYAEGMSRSLRAGIAAVPDDWIAALICLGDMPRVPSRLIAALAARARPDAVVQPVQNGRGGNPILWGREHFFSLMNLQGDRGAKALIRGIGDAFCTLEAPDNGIFADIDNATDLSMLRQYPATGG